MISLNLALIFAKSEVLFERYRMALNRDKYAIEVRDDDAIKRNQTFFDFMQRTFSILDRINMDEKFLLICTIKKDQLRKQSAEEVEKPKRDKKDRNK